MKRLVVVAALAVVVVAVAVVLWMAAQDDDVEVSCDRFSGALIAEIPKGSEIDDPDIIRDLAEKAEKVCRDQLK